MTATERPGMGQERPGMGQERPGMGQERPRHGPEFRTHSGEGFPLFPAFVEQHRGCAYCSLIIPLVVIGGGIYYTLSLLEEKTLHALTDELIGARESIDEFLNGRTKELKLLSSNLDLSYLASPGGLADLESLQRELKCFTDLGVIDDEGRHLAYVGPCDLLSKNYREAPWFKAMKGRDVYVSDVFSGFRKVPHFIIAVKQKSEKGYWILRATVDTEYFKTVVEF